jgi:hypothetical protein
MAARGGARTSSCTSVPSTAPQDGQGWWTIPALAAVANSAAARNSPIRRVFNLPGGKLSVFSLCPRPGESARWLSASHWGPTHGPRPRPRGLLSLRGRSHSEEPDDDKGPLLLRLAPMLR